MTFRSLDGFARNLAQGSLSGFFAFTGYERGCSWTES
jgi:hypothetical protein